MVLRAMPHVPGHDGVRLFLAAFGLLALLGGLGTGRVVGLVGPMGEGRDRSRLGGGSDQRGGDDAGADLVLQSTCGRAPGRCEAGHGADLLLGCTHERRRRWLTENTLPDRTIESRTFPRSWLYLRRTGELPRRFAASPSWRTAMDRDPESPGNMMDIDRTLISRGRKAYIVTKLGVPLIWIFPFSDLERLARRLTARTTMRLMGRGADVASPVQGAWDLLLAIRYRCDWLDLARLRRTADARKVGPRLGFDRYPYSSAGLRRDGPAAAGEPGPFRFVDICPGSGVDFVHVSGMTAEKLFPTANGSGVAVFDYDGDGKLDLYFATGNTLPLSATAGRIEPALQEPGRRKVPRRDRALRPGLSRLLPRYHRG